MKNYKEFVQKYIGDSDIASLTIRMPSKAMTLDFGADGSYSAYECIGNDVEIGSHYEKVASGECWLKIYDDFKLTYVGNHYNDKYDKFDIYRAGNFGCIIHWHE